MCFLHSIIVMPPIKELQLVVGITEKLEEKGQFLFSSKLLYKSKCPSVCMSVRFWGKSDFLGPYIR